MYNHNSSPILEYIEFSGNSSVSGGGMYNSGGNPKITDVIIDGNTADYGGGMANGEFNATLMNVTFSDNTGNVHGGAIYNAWSSPTLTNVTVSGNTAAFGGGMFGDTDSNPVLTNVTFFNNSANSDIGAGGGRNNPGTSTSLTNAIFWGNTPDQNLLPVNATFIYSEIQGWTLPEHRQHITPTPNLGTLAENGGIVETHALGHESGVDTGSPNSYFPVWTRAVTRAQLNGESVLGARL